MAISLLNAGPSTVVAEPSDLPYALVTPGEWEFSGSGYDPNETYRVRPLDAGGGDYTYFLESYDSANDDWIMEDEPLFNKTATEMSLNFSGVDITATRASLPGHLLDRAGNRVVVSGDTTLTLPAANPGYIRDFLVRLEISGSTVPTITFSPDGNESVTYETDGDEFPVPDAEGTWLYSFTETAAHKFAVSLKKVNTVAQGGS